MLRVLAKNHSKDMENSEDSTPSPTPGLLDERNCVSCVVIWQKFDFNKKLDGIRGAGGDGLKKILQNISECVKSFPSSESEVKFESQSTLSGNQVRKDLVFQTEKQAKDFNFKVIDSVQLPVKVSMKTFLFSEAELGFQQKPVLTEQDVLYLLVKQNKLSHFFRHFLTCKVITEDNKIMFRFNNISDVNLFLYNKCSDPSKRTIGLLRENQEKLKLLPDRNGEFSLITSDNFLPNIESKTWNWDDWENEFKFRSKKLGVVKHLQFVTKIDLYTFFVSEDAKVCATLEVPLEQIMEDKFSDLECLGKAKADEQEVKSQLAAVEKELKAAKVDLAKKETVFENQNKIIKELRKELQSKLTKSR